MRIIKPNKNIYLPHQEQFVFDMKTRFLGLVGGYGSGKTFCFLKKTFYHLLMDKSNEDGKARMWVLYPDIGLAEELFLDPFLSLLEKQGILYIYNKQKRVIKTDFGFIKIHTMNATERLVGGNLTSIGVDEYDVVKKQKGIDVFIKLSGRLRGMKNAQFYTTSTPEGYRGLYHIFVENNDEDKRLIRAKSYDNPYLDVNYIESLKKQYDPKLIEQYLEGSFVNINANSAYYNFDRKVHLVDNVKVNNFETLHIGIDFNVSPMTATVSKFDGYKLTTFDEIWINNGNTRIMCQEIKNRYPMNNILFYPDMTGRKRQTSAQFGVTDLSIIAEFFGKSSIIGVNNPLVSDRLNVVNSNFYQNKLFVCKKCVRLINDLEKVNRKDDGGLDGSDKDLTHISDGYGYKVFRLLPIIPKGSWIVK